MSFYFVEDRHPTSDPNMDLDFTNDILYQHIIGDESIIDPSPYDNGNIVPNNRRKPRPSDRTIDDRMYGNTIVILLLIIMILLFVGYYYIGNTKTSNGYIIPIQTYGPNNGMIRTFKYLARS
jgi:hypothetical protein